MIWRGCAWRKPDSKLEHFAVVLASVDAGRAEILCMHKAGEIHDRILKDLEHELDLQQVFAENHAD